MTKYQVEIYSSLEENDAAYGVSWIPARVGAERGVQRCGQGH